MKITVLAALAACASGPLPEVRFTNASPITVVDDRRDVAQPPKPRNASPTAKPFSSTSVSPPNGRRAASPRPPSCSP